MGRRRKRIPVSEETHRFLKLKKVENGAETFDDLLKDLSEDAFGERPENKGEQGLPRLEDTLKDALFSEEK